MPMKPKRPCSYPGCPHLTNNRYCDHHQKVVDAHYEKYERDPTVHKRYGRAWRKIRDSYLAAHPLCEQCAKDDTITVAEEVHHILPLSKGGNHDVRNLMSLCASCHSKITAKDGDRWKRRGRSNG